MKEETTLASLEVVGAWVLALMVKLGIPVVVLFVLGWVLYQRHSLQDVGRARWSQGRPGGTHTFMPKGGERSPRCWELRDCPPETRDPCPAYRQPQLPCWQAVKQASRGRIQSKCLDCGLLLSR